MCGYEGAPIRAVRDDPEEFVREGFEMLRLLQRESAGNREAP